MFFRTLFFIGLLAAPVSGNESESATLPIKDAREAISVAKEICLRHGGPLMDEDMNETTIAQAMPSLKWSAELLGDRWDVTTMPSVQAHTNSHLLVVEIPVSRPLPAECQESLYTLFDANPKPPKPLPAHTCTPSDISATDAQILALETLPNGGPGMRTDLPRSEIDAWIVITQRAGSSESNPGPEAKIFKVFKRTAVVQDTVTGKLFTSLSSRGQFVEHHCLNGVTHERGR